MLSMGPVGGVWWPALSALENFGLFPRPMA